MSSLHSIGMKEKGVKSETDSEGFYLLDFLGFKSLVEPSESKLKGWVKDSVWSSVFSVWCDYEIIMYSLSFLRIWISISLHDILCHVLSCLLYFLSSFHSLHTPSLPFALPSSLACPPQFTMTTYPFTSFPCLSLSPPPLSLLTYLPISPSHQQTPSD